MKYKTLKILFLLTAVSFSACTQNSKIIKDPLVTVQNEKPDSSEPHRYGGWYCPDNLNGFPPVDIKDWENVPVVNGRMATQEETQNGTSLIFVDADKYPNAKPLNITMPQLAYFYCESTKRKELVIVIQAINVDNDSVVGFRYLNGGNGSARLTEVDFVSENDTDLSLSSKFVTKNININASQDKIWEILENANYSYANGGEITSSYAGNLFGNFYIQNDYDQMHYNEKFLLLDNNLTKQTILKIVCGPFAADYEAQKEIITKMANQVKELSEK